MNQRHPSKPQRRGSFQRTHGHNGSNSGTYRSWLSMKSRVLKSTKPAHTKYYRGLEIHHEWLTSFEAFLRDLGERPDGMTLDRIDNSKGYVPGNVRWATAKVQGTNRACVRPITYLGRTLNPEEWALELGLKPQTIRSRLDRGWPLERVLKPGKPRKHKGRLTPEKVLEIRRLASEGHRQADIGRRMGLKTEHIHSVIARTSWRHIP